jgi:DNA-binding NarL/FixJ family response regulator
MTVTSAPTRARVVVADDDVNVRDALCELLEHRGCAVVGRATDGAEAVTVTSDTDPDVVLMDLRMPGVDGISACRQIKDRFPTTQVIILSAYDDESFRELADGIGVYCYLVKGCPGELILDMVVRAFRMKREVEAKETGD